MKYLYENGPETHHFKARNSSGRLPKKKHKFQKLNRTSLFNFLGVLAAMLFLFSSCTLFRERESPDIILINIDDMGWRDLGYMGSEYYETPVIDSLARQGMIFTSAYASASNCAPSRACMMSGQWTPRHGIYTVNSSERGRSANRMLIPTPNQTILHDSVLTLADVLQSAGYQTCHAGKWHIGPDPRTQGFDVNIGGCEAGNPGSYYPPYTRVPLEAPDSNYYLTNLIMDKVLEFIDTAGTEPLFLYYAPYAVHTPIHPVKGLLSKYESKAPGEGQDNAGYASMVENLDTQIGRLVERLYASGRMKNTLIVFTSDNGGVYRISKQWPLRAGKGSYYEGGIREPFFAMWPGVISAGQTCDVPISNLDLFPTLLEAARIEVPTDKILDGQSIMTLLKGSNEFSVRPFFWHFPIYLENGNEETADVIFRTRPGSAIRLGDWKLIKYYEDGREELYNLYDDISERNNLINTEPEKAGDLSSLLLKWQTDMNAPVPVVLNPEYNPEESKETQ